MPFTVAHAVAAVPLAALAGGRLAASALTVGAMSPDLEMLLVVDRWRGVGHSPLGVVAFCVPASLAVLALWHGAVKRPLAGLLPPRWGHLGVALCRPLDGDRRRLAATTVAAVVVGASSHVIWDSFTHVDGLAVAALPLLRRELLGRPLFEVAQYGCSAGGLVALAVVAVVWARRQPRAAAVQAPRARRVAGVTAIATFTAATAAANVARHVTAPGPVRLGSALVAAVIGTTAGAVVAVTAYGVAQSARRARSDADVAPDAVPARSPR